MKKNKVCVIVLSALMACAVMSCKPEVDGTTVNPGDVVSKGIKIGETTFAKTSEVAIVPAGKTGVVDMKDDSSWDTYIEGEDDWLFEFTIGVFIKDRKVTLSPFVMSQYEVTQELYEVVMGVNPSYFVGADTDKIVENNEVQKLRPVECVNYFDTILFCNELTKKAMTEADCVYFRDEAKTSIYTIADATAKKIPYIDRDKKGYRLPTEAEWEYAARGGNPNSAEWKNAFGKVTIKGQKIQFDEWPPLGEDENLATVGWYDFNSNEKTHEVGMKSANNLNLYDMQGNVHERCVDVLGRINPEEVRDPLIESDDYNIHGVSVRGGSCYNAAWSCTVSNRYDSCHDLDDQSALIGFRVVRSIR